SVARERDKQSQGETEEMRRHGAFYALFRSLALKGSLARRMRPRQLLPRVARTQIGSAGHDNGQPVCCVHSTAPPSGWRPASIASTMAGDSSVSGSMHET
ncbi:MAG: hypothetical protein ACK5TQ_16060, partial [Acetobacteraceae bacterium]